MEGRHFIRERGLQENPPSLSRLYTPEGGPPREKQRRFSSPSLCNPAHVAPPSAVFPRRRHSFPIRRSLSSLLAATTTTAAAAAAVARANEPIQAGLQHYRLGQPGALESHVPLVRHLNRHQASRPRRLEQLLGRHLGLVEGRKGARPAEITLLANQASKIDHARRRWEIFQEGGGKRKLVSDGLQVDCKM